MGTAIAVTLSVRWNAPDVLAKVICLRSTTGVLTALSAIRTPTLNAVTLAAPTCSVSFTIFTPDWVYNGDHGIASINFGVEMGQHCIINPMHCNLKFDDGTPMDPSLPKGVVGWLAKTLSQK